jgi:hypothetical protein
MITHLRGETPPKNFEFKFGIDFLQSPESWQEMFAAMKEEQFVDKVE